MNKYSGECSSWHERWLMPSSCQSFPYSKKNCSKCLWFIFSAKRTIEMWQKLCQIKDWASLFSPNVVINNHTKSMTVKIWMRWLCGCKRIKNRLRRWIGHNMTALQTFLTQNSARMVKSNRKLIHWQNDADLESYCKHGMLSRPNRMTNKQNILV